MSRIFELREQPSWLSAIAAQQWKAWDYESQADLEAFFAQGLSSDWPKTWFILDDQETLLGSISLALNEMGDCQPPSRNPWLGFLYVAEAVRGQGIGQNLMQYVEQWAATHQITTLYLYTTDQTARYQRWGWQVLERIEYLGEWVDIMSKNWRAI